MVKLPEQHIYFKPQDNRQVPDRLDASDQFMIANFSRGLNTLTINTPCNNSNFSRTIYYFTPGDFQQSHVNIEIVWTKPFRMVLGRFADMCVEMAKPHILLCEIYLSLHISYAIWNVLTRK